MTDSYHQICEINTKLSTACGLYMGSNETLTNLIIFGFTLIYLKRYNQNKFAVANSVVIKYARIGRQRGISMQHFCFVFRRAIKKQSFIKCKLFFVTIWILYWRNVSV